MTKYATDRSIVKLATTTKDTGVATVKAQLNRLESRLTEKDQEVAALRDELANLKLDPQRHSSMFVSHSRMEDAVRIAETRLGARISESNKTILNKQALMGTKIDAIHSRAEKANDRGKLAFKYMKEHGWVEEESSKRSRGQ